MTRLTLALDASTYAGTAALFDGVRRLGHRAVVMRGEREERLMPAVASLMDEHLREALGHIICGGGPGSFTSLRIAASLAKGLALATGATLHAVPSLMLVVAAAEAARRPGRWLASLDAMRGDRYAQLFVVQEDGGIRAEGERLLVSREELPALAASLHAERIGPGEPVDAAPDVVGVQRLLPEIVDARPLSLDHWEPDYGRLAEAQVKWEAAHGRPLLGA